MSNHKTPNFAYGNFSFQEKGFNKMIKGYATLHPYFCYAKTSFITDIRRNSDTPLKSMEQLK